MSHGGPMTKTALRVGVRCVAFVVLASGCDSSKLSESRDGGFDTVVIRLDTLPASADLRPGTDTSGPVTGTDARDVGGVGVGDGPVTPIPDAPVVPGTDTRPGPEVGPLPQPNP